MWSNLGIAFQTGLVYCKPSSSEEEKKILDESLKFLNGKHSFSFIISSVDEAFDLFSSLVFILDFTPDLLDFWSHRMFSVLLCVKEGDGRT